MTDQGDNNAWGVEKIITKPGQAPVAHFISGLGECEKKTVVWEVRNIAELLGMSTEKMEKNGITFDAGHSIGIPATWNFYFSRSDRLGFPGNFLELSPDSKAKVVKASCLITLSCDGETIASTSLNPRHLKLKAPPPPMKAVRYGKVWIHLTESDILEKTDNGRKPLMVIFTVNIFSSKDSVKTPKAGLLKNEALISDFGKMLESGDGADVEISVPSEDVDASSSYTRMVHKGILMSRSTVFSAMCAKESTMIEAQTGKVIIKDLSPKGLDIFLHYIYTEKVLDEWVKVPEEILNASEKYDCGTLKNYCGRNLMSAVTTKNAWEMFQLAKLHKLSFAKRAITEFISKNTRNVLNDGEEDTTEAEESDTE